MKNKILLTLALWLVLIGSTWAQNNALHFDGSNDYVTCPAINPENFTVEAWVYPTLLNRDQPAFSTLSETANTGMELHIAADNKPVITIRNGSSWLDAKATSTVSKDTWVHLAATYNGSTVTLYVNGVEAKTASATAYNPGSKALYIGKRTEGNASNFAGKIDEVRVWSTARSQTEIAATMNTSLAGTETYLQAYYNFNQGTAGGDNTTTITTLTDATANNYHGTLNGFTLSGTASNFVAGYTNSLTASSAEVSIERINGSTATFNIASNTTWGIVDADDWLDLDVTSGTGNGTITLTANETNTTDATRSIQLVITGTNAANDTVTVTQQRGTISVSASSASINSSVGSTTTFDITSNTDWTIAESTDWFSVSPVSGSGNATITVTADLLNNSSNPRSASLTISGTNATDTTVTITQGPATIALSRTAVDIDAPANSHAYFFVTTDVDWQTTCSASWLTLNKTSGTGNDAISITAEALPEGVTERYANIVFTGVFQSDGVVVTQKALPNNALHFDNDYDYVVCKPVAPSQFTAESWVYLDNVSDHKTIINNTNGNSYYKNFRFEIEYNKLSLYMGYGSNWNTLVSNTTIEANKWYHVAASFDGSVAKFYINGVQDASTQTISSFTTAEDIPLYIGAYYLSTTYYPFKGKMDDVRLWSHARSAEEIMSDLNNQTTDNTGLLVWYNFNQGITNGNNAGITPLNDASGNLNDGTLTNFALNGTTSNWVEGTPGKFLLANTSTTGFTAEAGSTTVAISSNTNWELINNTNWLTPDVTEGNGNATVTLAYTANNNHNERSNTVAFATQGVDTVFITFTQQPGKVLSANFSADNTNSSVIPATITFTDASTATNTTITSWAWDFGDGSTSTDQNPVHTYTDFGSYTVTLIVYDGTFSDTLINAGYINTSNDILMHSGEVTISDSVYFYDSGGANNQYANSENYTLVFQPSIPGASIKLDFISFKSEPNCDYLDIYNGANTSATILAKQIGTTCTTPLQSNNTSGVLCAYFYSDGSSLRDGWKALVTQVLPNAAFTVLDTLVWVDSEVAFTDASVLAALNAWSWDFGDGSDLSNDQNPTHTYTATGTYTVTLTASNGTVSKSTTKTIQVVDAPIARFTADITTGFQPTVQFTNTCIGATSYAWNFGDGSDLSTEQNPQHTYTTSGIFDVTLTVSDGYSSNTLTRENYITSDPLYCNFNANNTQGYLQTVTFTDASSGNITSWAWDFGDGTTSTDQNPVHTYQTMGSYTITLTISDGTNTNMLIKENYIVTDILLMSSVTVNLTNEPIRFYDSGGLYGAYGCYERSTMVIYPTDPYKMVQIHFSSFFTESYSDYLRIYNGSNNSAPYLAYQTGRADNQTVTANNANGALCLYFYSDGLADYKPGWEATITQVDKQLVLTWPAPADITYGTALNLDILNATANMPGTFTYNYPIGTMFNTGTHTLTATFTPENTNYPVTTTSVTLTVNKAELLATANNLFFETGTDFPELTFNYTGFVNAETADVIDLAPTIATNATASSEIGEYLINVVGGYDNNYNIVHQYGLLTVFSRVNPVITWVAPDAIVYGTALSATQLNAIATYNSNPVEGTFDYIPALGSVINAGNTQTLTVTFTPDDINTYKQVAKSVTINVNKAELTVTADSKTKVYGDANPELTLTYTGFVNSENESVLDAIPQISTSANTNSPVANYPITLTNVVDNNYNITCNNSELSVTARTLTLSAFTANNKVYDGTTTVTGTGFADDRISGDELTFTYDAAFETKTAGTSKTVNYTNITIGGADAANYSLVSPSATVLANIDQKELTVEGTFTVENKTYDAGSNATIIDNNLTINGLIINDDVIYTPKPMFENSNVGNNIAVFLTQNGSLSGADANNYILQLSDAPAATANITHATLTVTANNQIITVGQPIPELTLAYAGFLNNQNESVLDVKPVAATTATAESPEGEYPITVNGGSDNNYNFIYVDGSITIAAKQIPVIAWVAPDAIVYGTALSATQLNAIAKVDDNVVEGTYEYSPAIGTVLNTGNNQKLLVTFTPDDLSNYVVVTDSVIINVTKAALTATADNKTKVYGSANPELTVAYTGFVNGDDATILDEAVVAATEATAESYAGTYAINLNSVTDNNYEVTTVAGELTVTKAALTATADNKTKVYGSANPELTVAYAGFVNGDDATVLDEAVVAATEATTESNTGTYAITLNSVTDNNYTITTVAGELTVTKAALTATADNKTKVYGSANPELTVAYAGFVNGDDATILDEAVVAATEATAESYAGTYAITLNSVTDNNYEVATVAGELTVTKAELTATANNQTIELGSAIPELTVAYTGFVNNDTETVLDTKPVATTTATAESAAGEYEITVAGGADNNYSFTYVAGKLTITAKQVPVITWAAPEAIIYGTALSATQLNAVAKIDDVVVEGTYEYSPAIGTVLNAGSAQVLSVTFTPTDAETYETATASVIIDVTKAELTATANNQTSELGSAIPELTVAYAGFVNNDTDEVIDTKPVATTTATAESAAGEYDITVAGGADNNYSFVYVAGKLTITAKQVPVITWATPEALVYGTALSATQLNAVAKVADVVVEGTYEYSPAIGTVLNAGSEQVLSVTFTPADAETYETATASVNIDVTKAELTATAASFTIELGSAIPELTVAYAGFVNNDTETVLDTKPVATTTATADSAAGEYEITVAGGADNNYSFTYVAGKLTITAKQVPVITWAAPGAIVYGTALSATQFNAVAKVADNVIEGTYDYSPAIGTVLNAGSAQVLSVTFTPADAETYETATASVSIDVTKAELTATANNQTIELGSAIPSLTVAYAGFVNNDTETVLDTKPVATITATAESAAGEYDIIVAGGADNNYSFVYVAGKLTITPKTVTPELNVSVTELKVEALEASTASFEITANIDWTVTVSETWLTASAANGNGNSQITLTAAANKTTSKRVATVTVAGNGVQSKTITVTQDAGVGIDDNNAFVFSVYPNPATDNINVSIANSLSDGTVEVFNIAGAKVCQQPLTGILTNINVAKMPQGLYIIKVLAGGHTAVSRFVKN